MVTLLTACTDGSAIYKIGVSQCSSGPWRDKVNQEMLAAQHLYEHDVVLSIANSYDDVVLQAQQIDSLAATGIDLLVVAPNEDTPVINEAISRVRRAGIPVICFDRKASADYTAFIGGNNVEAGEVVGRHAVALADKLVQQGRRPRIVEVTGDMTSSPAQERHRGFERALQGYAAFDYVCQRSDWSSDGACRIIAEEIAAGRIPDIVFCHNDGMATGVYKAVVESGDKRLETAVQVLGIDGMPGEGLEYVQFGHQVGTYVYPTHGEQVVRLALNILTGKDYERDVMLHGIMVTPENVEQTDLTARELNEQNQHLITIQDKLEEYLGFSNVLQKLLIGSGVAIVLLIVGLVLAWRAYRQMRQVVHERQAMNEEQTLFYTNPDSRTLRQVFETPKEQLPAPRSQDTIFAETLNEAIRQHMSNPNLKMDDLGDVVGLSRVQLYRKVKAITGLSPVELLRQMRLQQGYVLLTTTNKTVQEIAYEVGFGTPGYFSKCFRQQYGKYPMELRS